MKYIVITGCCSGLGKEVARLLHTLTNDNYLIGIDQDSKSLTCLDDQFRCDLSSPAQIQLTCNKICTRTTYVDILINCAGVNEIAMLESIRLEDWDRVINVNARAVFLLTRNLLPLLVACKGTILNIISNASHMPMTSSLVYNASKGALHIMTLQMARELTRRFGITVFGISPNKMAGTQMSHYIEHRVCEVRGWSADKAAEYQQQSLLTGEETDPAVVAEFIYYLLSDKRNHKYLSGCVIPYGA